MLTQFANSVFNLHQPSSLKGFSGTELNAGFITGEDENAIWANIETAVREADMMRKSDVRVRSALSLIKTPILGAVMRIEPASKDNRDMEIAKFVEDNLFNSPYFRWGQVMRELLTYLDFGHTVMEWSFIPIEGKMLVHRIEYRKPQTLFRWITENGELVGVGQDAVFFSDEKKKAEIMPAERLIHVANEMEGLNFAGRSIMRPAWINWKSKQQLIKYDLIKHQRFGAGIPRIVVKSSDDMDEAKNVAQNINAHEQSYLLEVEGKFKTDIFGGGGSESGTNALESIRFHDNQIVFNINANFATKGSDGIGSFAMVKVDSSIFFQSLEAEAIVIEDTFNEPKGRMAFIPRIVSENFAGVTQLPKFRLEKLALADLDGFAERLAKYIETGSVRPDNELEVWLRKREKMPEMGEPRIKPVSEELPPEIETEENKIVAQARKIIAKHIGRGILVEQGLLDIETKILDLDGIKKETQRVRDDLNKSVALFQSKLVDDLTARGVSILRTSNSIDEVSEEIEKSSMIGTAKLIGDVVSKAKEIFRFGRQTIRDEVARQKVTNQGIVEDPDEALDSIRTTTEAAIGLFLLKVRNEWGSIVMTQFKNGESDTDALRTATNRVSVNKFKKSVTEIATEAFGLGRGVELEIVKPRNIVRSEVLDENTCEPCQDVDGLEFDGVNDPDFARFRNGPFVSCLGGSQCRGINIPLV